jgi:molybdopterin adenylyltransferase
VATFKVGVLTISDSGARGDRPVDASGQTARELIEGGLDAKVEQYAVVPDERSEVEARLAAWADSLGLDLILTTGGTGLTPRDVTPEATLAVGERVVPGLAEMMRALTAVNTPLAYLSRSVAVTRGKTLIINLPGSPKGVSECITVLLPVLNHAIKLTKDEWGGH